jgi:hypothetical protein
MYHHIWLETEPLLSQLVSNGCNMEPNKLVSGIKGSHFSEGDKSYHTIFLEPHTGSLSGGSEGTK